MTREEAITRYNAIKARGDFCEYLNKEMVEMAIQALSQEPTVQDKQAESEKYQKAFDDGYENGYAQARFDYEQEPCDDAISREAVLDGLKGCICEEWVKTLFATMVKQLPSVTQKSDNKYRKEAKRWKNKWLKSQKSGHWIMSDDGLYRPICDKCGAHPWKGYIPSVKEATEVFKYCPNCGAKMVEPQESEVRNDKRRER